MAVVKRDTLKGGGNPQPPFDICEYRAVSPQRSKLCRELMVRTYQDYVPYSRFEDSKLVSGVGDKAYYREGGLQIYKGAKFVVLRLSSSPVLENRRGGWRCATPEIPSDAHSLLVNLAKLVASRM